LAAATVKTVAYVDEVATLSNDDPAAIGTTAAEGVGTTASRDDHVHVLGAGCVDDATLDNAAGVLSFKAIPIVAPGPTDLVAGMAYLDSGVLKVVTVSYSA
jgi:hypothetical protein